ncbi:MAG: hypothetical protein PHO48_03885 [Candidatus Gracilibacteria bacterium]|nr:hypothetical protein [Candidatus Gracilibacteria bacterium]MDD5179577.1 hypothetical protein [Candidatus Gracilibacteria bacterium]
MKSFHSLKNGLDRLIPGIGTFLWGIFLLIFLETPKDLYCTFAKSWRESKNISHKASTVFAGLIVSLFIAYSFWGLLSDFYSWKTSEWREKILFIDYETEIKDFFNKYDDRFAAHDCNFMREVGADEAMFDKWKTTAYAKDKYSCEEFVRVQKKFVVPLKIEPIKKDGDRYHVKGEAIVIKINQGESWKVESIYFDLWKKLDWELWHFNNPKSGPRKIPTEIES